jgi:hypothetical protein
MTNTTTMNTRNANTRPMQRVRSEVDVEDEGDVSSGGGSVPYRTMEFRPAA